MALAIQATSKRRWRFARPVLDKFPDKPSLFSTIGLNCGNIVIHDMWVQLSMELSMATPLLTVPDAAVRIGVSARVMRNEVLGPDGPATVFVGRRMMIDADDLAAWWERRRRASATKASAPQLDTPA